MPGGQVESEESSLALQGYAGLVAAKQARIHEMIRDVSSQSIESAPVLMHLRTKRIQVAII